jgi:1-acyl-sn-glycerol-3-phosphate acyltransferase
MGARATKTAAPAVTPTQGSLALGLLRVAIFVVATVVFIPIVLLAAVGDREGRRAYAVARWWAWLNLRVAGVSVAVNGLAHLDRDASYVFMANHRSALDVLTLVVALWDVQLRWVAKRELGRIPGFGWCLRATKQIVVDRGDHERATASLSAARDRLRGGVSVVFFPEVTRSSGPLLPFQKRGFAFAIETGAAIVPVGIAGPKSLLRPDGALCRWRTRVQVSVRPPIPTVGLSLADREVLLPRVRWVIASASHERRQAPPVRGGGFRDVAQAAAGRSRR